MLNKVLNKTEEIIEVEKFDNNTILIDTVGDITSKNNEKLFHLKSSFCSQDI